MLCFPKRGSDRKSNEKHNKNTSKKERKSCEEKAEEVVKANKVIFKDLEPHLSEKFFTYFVQIGKIHKSISKCFDESPCLTVEECMKMHITMRRFCKVLGVEYNHEESQNFEDKYAKEIEKDCYYYFDKNKKEKVMKKINRKEVNKILEIVKERIDKDTGKIRETLNICIEFYGLCFMMEVYETERIDDVERRIGDTIKRPPGENNIRFAGNILESDKLVGECGITSYSVIKVESRSSMVIIVKTFDGNTTGISVDKKHRIKDLKQMIEVKIGLKSVYQRLFFHDVCLQDDETLEEHCITEESTVNVSFGLSADWFEFAVQTMDGRMFQIGAYPSERIGGVKKKIQEEIGLEPDDQKLVFNGEIMENYKTLNEYQIDNRSVIYLVPRAKTIERQQISLRTEDGRNIQTSVEKIDKIRDIKVRIRYLLQLYSDTEVTLIYEGRELAEDRTVFECGIRENPTIEVVDRLRCDLKIFIKISTMTRVFPIVLTRSILVRDVKRMILEKVGNDPKMKTTLRFNHVTLDDDENFLSYEIPNRSVITVDYDDNRL